MKPQIFSKFLFILITLLILACQSFAGNIADETASKETIATIRQTIQIEVSHPGSYILNDNFCCADVIFTINDEGKLIVKRIISDNVDLSDYVKATLSRIQFYKLESPLNLYYRIKLSFRLV